MNRRSLFKALIGASAGITVPAVAAAQSACRLPVDSEGNSAELKEFAFNKTWIDRSQIWIGLWTGWKENIESANLYGQAIAKPMLDDPKNKGYTNDIYRPWVYCTSGGHLGVYVRNQCFDLTHKAGFPQVYGLTDQKTRNNIARETVLRLVELIHDRLTPVDWYRRHYYEDPTFGVVKTYPVNMLTALPVRRKFEDPFDVLKLGRPA